MFSMGNMVNSSPDLEMAFIMAKPRGMTVVDRTGERHGRLLVLSRAANKVEPSGAVRAQWNCACDCGGTITVPGHSLSRGLTRSCGCLLREKESKHGMSRTAIYRIWNLMRQRCTNANSTHYASYGGRGITVCPEWMEFENFYRDMGDRPAGLTLERIDNDKGYEPGNVRWASRLEQGNNRRTNVFITHDGQTKTVAEWGRETGLGKSTLFSRLARGWSAARTLTEPSHEMTGQGRRKKH